jgi:predicted enzyme related to lactoylglutathione lyase
VGDSNRLVLVVLEVADADRSAALYRDAFGVELHLEDHGGDDRWISGRHAARSWHEGSYLHLALYEAKTSEVTTRAQVGFTVDDIEDAHRVAVAAGAEVVHPPRREPWGSTSRYRDFDGNVVSLTQQDPSSAD